MTRPEPHTVLYSIVTLDPSTNSEATKIHLSCSLDPTTNSETTNPESFNRLDIFDEKNNNKQAF